MLSKNIILIVRTFKEPHRSKWKYDKLSPKQVRILAPYVDIEDLIMLDRGNASLLIDCIFSLNGKDIRITDNNVANELDFMINDL